MTRLQVRARRLWRWLFPPEIELPEAARRRLAALFPTLDLRRVSFHRGLPHLLRGGSEGMALPAPFSPVRCRIYIQPELWRPETDPGFSLIAHEAFHALQMQEAGAGIGLVRPFLVLYLACWAGNRFQYLGHPLEEDAYDLAGRWLSRFERAVKEGEEPAPVAESGVRFWRKLAASAPGGVLFAPVWLLAWTGATALLWVARLALEGLGAGTVAGMWIVGGVVRLVERAFRS